MVGGEKARMAMTRKLDGALRHADAGALAAELSAALQAGDLVLETEGVTQASMGILQIIVSAQVTARVLDRNLQVKVAPGSPFAEALDRAGLTL